MARGWPAFWSTLLATPFLGSALHVRRVPAEALAVPGAAVGSETVRLVQYPLAVFGLFIVLGGLYVQTVAPDEPSLRSGESVVDVRIPGQRVAVSKLLVGLPFLGAAAYLFEFTRVPYVYPTGAFLAGLFLFSSGVTTYWANSLTTYYVTSERVISEYRFLALRRQELPLGKIRGVEERKSVLETLVGLGNIRVASGGGGGSVQVVMRNISRATEFADELRELMGESGPAEASRDPLDFG